MANNIKIFLTCPDCGCSDWIVRNDEEAEGAFQCANCGELSFTEDMDATASDDENLDINKKQTVRKNAIKLLLTCPECGCSDWVVRTDEDAEGAFECADCGILSFTENMDATASDNENLK